MGHRCLLCASCQVSVTGEEGRALTRERCPLPEGDSCPACPLLPLLLPGLLLVLLAMTFVLVFWLQRKYKASKFLTGVPPGFGVQTAGQRVRRKGKGVRMECGRAGDGSVVTPLSSGCEALDSTPAPQKQKAPHTMEWGRKWKGEEGEGG